MCGYCAQKIVIFCYQRQLSLLEKGSILQLVVGQYLRKKTNDMGNNLPFKEIGRKTIVDRIVEEMMDAIISQQWPAGCKIPIESELMEAFDVGRNSIRESVKVLVSMGMLEIRRADGTYVVDHFSEKMLNPLIYSLALEKDMERSMAELRTVFDVDSLELAVDHATEEDCRQIQRAYEELAERLRNSDASSEELLNADIAFHDAVASATHNTLFQRIHGIIIRLSRQSRIQELDYITGKGEREHMRASHEVQMKVVLERRREHVYDMVKDGYKYLDIAMRLKESKFLDV